MARLIEILSLKAEDLGVNEGIMEEIKKRTYKMIINKF